MKTKFTKLLMLLTIFVSTRELKSQCTTPAMPAITGQTYAPCVGSNVFTIAANPTGTNVTGWYANPWGGNAITTNSVYVTPTITQSASYYANQFNAQSTSSIGLPAYISGYSGNTRGMWFQAPADFVITGLRVPLDVGGTGNTAIAVMKFPTAPPVFASTTNSFNTLFIDQNFVGTGIIPVNIPVYTGDYIGILGARGGVTSYGPSGSYLATIGTTTVNLTRLGMQYVLSSQTPTDVWQEPTGSLGRIEVYTTMGCLSPMAPVTVSVAPAPQILISGPAGNVCANTTTTLTATGVSSYTWFSGSNNSSITVTPSSNTTYSVIGSISPTCGTSAAITISVDPGLPSLTVTPGNSALCSGNSATLTATGATTYSWTGGITNGASFTPSVTTTYIVTGANSCGSVTAQRTITVNITPTLQIPATGTVCEGSSITLTVGGASTYTWSSNNQTIQSGMQISVNPTITTLYQVFGLSAQNCSATASQVVLVSPVPIVNAFSSNQTICYGKSATLTANGNAHTYSWNPGGGAAVTVVSPTITSTYYATGTFTDTQCSRTASVLLNVFKPVPAVTSATSVCLGSAVTLTASGATNFTWQPGPGQFSSFSPSPTVSTTYTVAGITTSMNATCTGSNTVLVTVNQLPDVQAVSTRTSICKNEKTVLTATGAGNYTWTGVTSSNATVQVNPIVQTLYSVSGADQNNCVGTATILVKVNACTGVDEFNNEIGYVVYPNPSAGSFILKADKTCDYILFNGLGQVIVKGQAEGGQATEFSNISAGVYFLQLDSGKNGNTQKIIVK